MAAKLAEKHGAAKLDSYAALGGLAFVEDYQALARPSITKDLQPSEDLKPVLAELAADWRETNTEYVRKLTFTSATDLDVVGKQLRDSFKGTNVYPNLVNGLFAVTRQSVLANNRARALKAAQLSADLYPESITGNFALGLVLVLNGDSAAGQERLRKSATLNPTGPASAGGLNNVAYQLAGAGLVDEALTLLRTGIEIYPKEANLYDSIGEFHLRKGDKVKALEFYQKALDVNPNFPNATAARDVVKRLSAELAQKN